MYICWFAGASADEVQLLRDQLKTLNTELLTLRNTLNLKEKAAAKHKHPAANKTQGKLRAGPELGMIVQLNDNRIGHFETMWKGNGRSRFILHERDG